MNIKMNMSIHIYNYSIENSPSRLPLQPSVEVAGALGLRLGGFCQLGLGGLARGLGGCKEV